MNQVLRGGPRLDATTSLTSGVVIPTAPLIGASGLAGRALISDAADRPKSLAECFEFVAGHDEVPEYFRQELVPARKRIEGATGCDASQLPSAPVALRPILAKIQLKKIGTSHKRWNTFTVLQSVLILCGWVSPEAKLRYKLAEPLEALLIAAAGHGKRRALAAFLRYCDRRGLALAAINSDTLIT
jgi:hypothetical protein